ncbi:MAG: hypothetical protein ACRD3W_28325 [Terriglobales bacterium]
MRVNGAWRLCDDGVARPVLDMSVLGRDITNLLALVIDHPGDAVCLLYPGEIYQA